MSLPGPDEFRGSPNCYLQMAPEGEMVFVDVQGNRQCVKCFKDHTKGQRREGCDNCGGPERSPEDLVAIKVANALNYGIPAKRLTSEEVGEALASVEEMHNQMFSPNVA